MARFIAAMNSELGVGEVFNLGSSFEISIGDTARCIAEAMGKEIEIVTDDDRLRPVNSEVERLFASNEKAKQIFSWVPAYGGRDGFMRGLAETIAWFSVPSNLSHYKAGIYNI
jgi:dTDP-glucose 4,6-dehydratase